MKKRIISSILILATATAFFAGCGQTKNAEKTADSAEATNPMQYISIEDLKTDIDAGSAGYVLLDARKAADFDAGHIVGAYSGDVDAAINGDDHDTAKANLQAALKNATGNDNGDNDHKYVLICYSGKRYAQQATNYMVDMGIAPENIYTLEGGFTAWSEAGDDYTGLVE